MIHPDTELRKVNDTIGYGVFAKCAIPKGTIVYVKDPLEIEVMPDRFAQLDPAYQTIVNWFSYIDERAVRIVSWDIAKYVNHCCRPNTLSTGYGFEIDIRDIAAGEQITDEYGMFNLPAPLDCCCGDPGCRGRITGEDFNVYGRQWDRQARAALRCFGQVPQPLVKFMDTQMYQELMQYLHTRRRYRSILSLQATEQPTQLEKVH